MSKHLFGAIVTTHGVAANNRGETEGNTTTLQKILWQGNVHSTVSAESIRFAIRARWQQRGLPMNRTWSENAGAGAGSNVWEDPDFLQGGEPYVDDDVLGYMSAKAAKQDGTGEEDAATEPSDKKGKRPAKGSALVRRSRFEVTRAVSLSSWPGDVVFSVASIGATPSAAKKGANPVPYSGEVHATRYQYGFALTPESLHDRTRALHVVDAVLDLTEVAGNHARYYYDFSPETIIFRWTEDPAPRILYPFGLNKDRGTVEVPELVRRVQAGDIDPRQLIIGGSLANSEHGQMLRQAQATVLPGVKAAAEAVKRLLAEG